MIGLRPATLSDSFAIARLHAKNWQQNYRGIFSDLFLDKEVERDRSEFWYNKLQFPDKNQQVTIAMSDEDLVGFSCLIVNDNPVFGSLLDNLHVAVTWQNSGIGKVLMKECAKTVCETAINNKMYLWVYESNKNAINVYKRLGGTSFETIEKQNEDGTKAKAHRYIWNDVAQLLLPK